MVCLFKRGDISDMFIQADLTNNVSESDGPRWLTLW